MKTANVGQVTIDCDTFDLFLIDGVTYIDIVTYWNKCIQLRTDLFQPPESFDAVVLDGAEARTVVIASLEDLSNAIRQLSTYARYYEYISDGIIDLRLLVIDSLHELTLSLGREVKINVSEEPRKWDD